MNTSKVIPLYWLVDWDGENPQDRMASEIPKLIYAYVYHYVCIYICVCVCMFHDLNLMTFRNNDQPRIFKNQKNKQK